MERTDKSGQGHFLVPSKICKIYNFAALKSVKNLVSRAIVKPIGAS